MKITKLKCTDCKETTDLVDVFLATNGWIRKSTEINPETFETIKEEKVVTCWNCGGTEFYAIVEGEER